MIKWKKTDMDTIEISYDTGLEWQFILKLIGCIRLFNEISMKGGKK